jgi:hypothetical protein|tara:strand:+ start:214 stop:483 length:270 start_codon:yes stop_codon:yes gene_type:complete
MTDLDDHLQSLILTLMLKGPDMKDKLQQLETVLERLQNDSRKVSIALSIIRTELGKPTERNEIVDEYEREQALVSPTLFISSTVLKKCF